ncbi:Periplasmic pH-dependent serine endoprotease DegQ [Saezia sanguinis]|uniref:Periplasmic pH-dependent serine endoprotease DegQ n=1 Tax=Saezia sanguinis TaxID=1965230 RepID=A0A433SEH0_9BURK|nr:trypsin-like peptidase domain-containing protein [Saezia sanguinis]RUS67122.1 Periplasmic pH-dependent serine endoprotease DegQ [Saezia sanguinis]
MHKTWLIFAQSVTILVAIFFVVATLKPEWMSRSSVNAANNPRLITPISFVAPSTDAAEDTSNTAPAAPDSYAIAASRAVPAVVSISTSKTLNRFGSREDMWYRYYFGNPDTRPSQEGLGSGVVVSADGYILTNNHVVASADEIRVALTDGRQATATVIGTDPETDLALLKIDLDNLPVIILGDSDQTHVGDVVLAIGNPFGVGQTVTSGIISAVGRNRIGLNTFENFIQTDAAINPGNSGGALINTSGELIGINTAIYSRTGGSQGIGFAIPSSTAKLVMESLLEHGKVVRGWIGIEPRDLTPELLHVMRSPVDSGVLVTGVLDGSPASIAGIRPGDIVRRLGTRQISNTPQLLNAVASLTPGEKTPITVQRGDQEVFLTVVPGTRPTAAPSNR